MNHNRPFVDPNDRYSYEDWMNDMATKDCDWYTGDPVLEDTGNFVEAILCDGSEIVGELQAEEFHYSGQEYYEYFIVLSVDEEVSFTDVKQWRFIS